MLKKLKESINKWKAERREKKFLSKYPFWRGPFGLNWYGFIPEGWQKAFGLKLSEEIKYAGKLACSRMGKNADWDELCVFRDIKEKHGELCLYANAVPEVEHVLDKYSLLSVGYCVKCGKPARYMTREWKNYYCEDCFKAYLDSSSLPDSAKEQCVNAYKLTEKDIPHMYSYSMTKQGKLIKHVVNLKKIYGIDYKELWGL